MPAILAAQLSGIAPRRCSSGPLGPQADGETIEKKNLDGALDRKIGVLSLVSIVVLFHVEMKARARDSDVAAPARTLRRSGADGEACIGVLVGACFLICGAPLYGSVSIGVWGFSAPHRRINKINDLAGLTALTRRTAANRRFHRYINGLTCAVVLAAA